MRIGAPTFSYYTITNYYYQADAATGPWTTPLNAAGTSALSYSVPVYFNATTSATKTENIGVKYYRVRSVIQPKGYPSDAANPTEEVWSAVMRNQQVANGSSLVFVQW
jgi:hypothetical protein